MRVLLISANTETINMTVLPMGMAFVARALEDAGHEVSQINLMAEREALEKLAESIQKIKPDIIGISVRNIDDQVSLQPRFLLEPVKDIVFKKKILGLNNSMLLPICCRSQRVRGLHFSNL